jgi:type IX secretion system PorP/SprF family membrane protein
MRRAEQNKIIGIAFSIFFQLSVQCQQEFHFSSWSQNLSNVNPAEAGFAEEDIRFTSQMRLQWLTISGKALRTNSFSFDGKAFKNKTTGGSLGIGLNFNNDQTGDVQLNTNSISIPISYRIHLDEQSYFGVGIAPGYITKTFGSNNQTWDNQWNGQFFDNTISSDEFFEQNSSAMTIGAGFCFHYTAYDQSFFKIGLSVNHINAAPKIGNFGNNTDLYRTINAYFVGRKLNSDKYLSFSPQALVTLNGPNKNITLGCGIDQPLLSTNGMRKTNDKSYLTYALNYRWADAFVFSLALKYFNLKTGIYYDMNVSNLRNATKTFGSFEIFLGYQIRYGRTGFNGAYYHYRRKN